ncbi:MAG: hypothetical protein B7Y97_05665 [Sphingomonas sp. 32-66-10]|nr:MAG: hypothetical protein B7Y97_05665 [Sphingomonas sp. 32-66-10]
MFRILLVVFGLILPVAAQAQWTRAESTNFIAYSNGTPEDLKERVEALEKFGRVLQTMTGARRLKEVPVKIKVYFLPSQLEVADSLPYPAGGVLGYYNTTMRGPFTVMPRQDLKDSATGRTRFSALTVLQHELTHHFMFQYFPAAYPAWYVEGFADYIGAIEITDDNIAKIGLFLPNRAETLRRLDWVPLKELMNPIPGKSKFPGIAFYSQGWITVHYLYSTDAGRTKLKDYLRRINAGQSFGDALAAFGDMDAFDREVRAYSKLNRIPAEGVHYPQLTAGPITVEKLSPAASALVNIEMRMSAGVLVSGAKTFANRVRSVTRPYMSDPDALRVLADAERMAGNRAESLAAADRLLTLDPASPWGNYFRSVNEIDALIAAQSTDETAWDATRARLRAAMKALPNEPRFARAFYESYSRRGVLPPASAQNALAHALDLIPRENSLRLLVVKDYEARGMIQDAIDTLAPLAYGLEDESEKAKRQREKFRGQFREVDDEDDAETPREMLVRLLAKRDGKAAPAAGN